MLDNLTNEYLARCGEKASLQIEIERLQAENDYLRRALQRVVEQTADVLAFVGQRINAQTLALMAETERILAGEEECDDEES